MAKTTKPDQAAKSRMQSAAARNPNSKTARTGADQRIQSAADKNAAKNQGTGKSARK